MDESLEGVLVTCPECGWKFKVPSRFVPKYTPKPPSRKPSFAGLGYLLQALGLFLCFQLHVITILAGIAMLFAGTKLIMGEKRRTND